MSSGSYDRGMDTPYKIGQLTRREFRQRMDSGQLRACIIPLAATEQHLEHLAMEHDWRSTQWVAGQVAQQLSPHVIVAEACMVGISEHHMKHPGTLSLRPGTFLAVVSDVIDSMARAGFQHLVLLNGHGGNIAPLEGVLDQLRRQAQVNLQFLSYWDVLRPEDAEEVLDGGWSAMPGHAQEFETSFALAAFPENVRADAVGDQSDPLPAAAAAEKGQVLMPRIVQRLSEFVQQMIDGTRVTPTPDYYP